jgi:hypothetical protein
MKTTEPTPAAKRRKPGPRGVLLASAALFMVLLIFLSQRVAAGKDPVLGAPRRLAAQPILVHHIVKRVIVETTIHTHSHAAAASYSTSPEVTSQQSSESAVAAPVTRSS